MDDYPACSLDHNIPHVVLLGLSSESSPSPLPSDLKEQAVLIRSGVSYLETKHGAALLDYILSRDASHLPWNGKHATYRFRVRSAGNSILLPPRKARLPDDIVDTQPPGVPHSPFSPLSPACPLYPDGILDSSWLLKQQELVPSVLLCFYNLTADPTLATLHDNQIKSDISSLRNGLSQQGYKSRVVPVILSDLRTSSLDGTQERLDNIRKGCQLDNKSFFYMPSAYSPEEARKQADAMLTVVFGHAVEYYRDLGRRARKKKSRGVVPRPTVPPTTGTSQTTSLPGWNVRYDFKSAVFAEFRQEMDQALRSFEQAYETLTGPEVMEMIPSWTARWNEARQIADIIAFRCLRCMLWNGQTTAAVRRWQTHRSRISDLVNRRGRGTENYGWSAWEARWATMMAQLIDKVRFPELSASSPLVYLQPEKTAMGERLQPWELLHHPGYWHREASRHMRRRRAHALAIPEEDRKVMDPASRRKTTAGAFSHDTYMCPEPSEEYPLEPNSGGVNHTKLIVQCLDAAKEEFGKRGQARLYADLSLEMARELISVKQWKAALRLLKPIWSEMLFRKDGWIDVSEELAWLLRAVAQQQEDAELLISVDWELLNNKYTPRTNWHYDLSNSLEGFSLDEKPSVVISDDSSLPLLTTSFIFRTEEGNAGRACLAQLSIKSNAAPMSAPLILSSLQIVFDGSIKTVQLKHDAGQETKTQNGNVKISTVTLREETMQSSDLDTGASANIYLLVGSCNLTLLPGHTMVYEMGVILREPGEAKATSTTLSLSTETFGLDCIVRHRDSGVAGLWYAQDGKPRKIHRVNSHMVRILPRPPNVEIKLNNIMDQYYTNEAIELEFEIINAEDADAQLEVGVVIAGQEPPAFRVTSGDDIDVPATDINAADESRQVTAPLGLVISTGIVKGVIHIDPMDFSTTYELVISASYSLVTDPDTPVVQTIDFRLELVNPFEANYDLLPRLHSDPWPSIFDHEGVQALFVDDDTYHVQPRGLCQTWCLVTRYASFASEDLKVVGVAVSISPGPDVHTRISEANEFPSEGLLVKPKTIEEVKFDITAQRYSLDERDPLSLDVTFMISWRRPSDSDDHINTTKLPVPRLGIFGAEPRVLATVAYPTMENAGDMVQLDIVIENASNHFLTFGLNMEPSEQFAFSGPKLVTVHLLPVSRRKVTWRLLPLVRGVWVRPNLTVRDKYFQKLLRVIPTAGMKLDKEGFLIWIPPLAGQEEQKTEVGGSEDKEA
ncbi:hypothetical protein PspLS_03214 [Pyricularia sp. CBS 133598]|nr:hypothetical protein PspLS_03214 [Pyricularia sp. CBS 133598]